MVTKPFPGGSTVVRDPLISVIVPCRNESDHIETCLTSILRQEGLAGEMEVVVADGVSDDGTREILMRLAATHSHLRVIDNVRRITSCGMNAGIRNARGRYIAILGAHTDYARDYLRTCVELLEQHPEICCAGGPIISEGKSVFGRAIAAAMSHPVGVGNAKHRLPHYEGLAEGACFPVFRREVFEKIGLYDERLVRNQDDDFNFRVTRAGGKIFISPRAWCSYYVRESFSRLFSQYFAYGYWRVAVLRKHRVAASLRQLMPILFFVGILVLSATALWLPGPWRLIGIVMPLVYTGVLMGAGLAVARKRGVFVGLMFPIAAAIMHVSYAAGFAWGVVDGNSSSAMSASSSERAVV